jgi:hypothetical protein
MSWQTILGVMTAEMTAQGMTVTPWTLKLLTVIAKGIEAALAPIYEALP